MQCTLCAPVEKHNEINLPNYFCTKFVFNILQTIDDPFFLRKLLCSGVGAGDAGGASSPPKVLNFQKFGQSLKKIGRRNFEIFDNINENF